MWKRAAETYNVKLSDMQHTDLEAKHIITIPKLVGYNTTYCLFGHQIVGSVEIVGNLYGPCCAMVQADDMGLGKTTMVLLSWDMNFCAVL